MPHTANRLARPRGMGAAAQGSREKSVDVDESRRRRPRRPPRSARGVQAAWRRGGRTRRLITRGNRPAGPQGMHPPLFPVGPTRRSRGRIVCAAVDPRGAYRAVLRVAEARALIGASAVSQLGDWLYNAVLLGYVYEATGSAAWVGAATIFRLLPYVLLGPFGGMLADRYDKRAVLLAGDLVRCVLMLALAAVVAADGHVAVVIALTSLASAAGSAERPAALALLPRLVGESRLGPANALLHTVQDLGVVAGPAIGAVLLAATPDYVAFLVNAGTFAASAALITRLRSRARASRAEADDSALAQLRRGLRSARATRYVAPLLIVLGVV